MKRKLWGLFCGCAMILILLDGQTAQEGVRQGILLCGKSLIPALLPFMLLSQVLIQSLWGESTTFSALWGKLFRMPKGSEFLLLPAFLGGFPTGAAAVGKAWRSGKLNKETAEHLLGWCSNVGPSFLFGIAAKGLSNPQDAFRLWGLILLGALISAWIIPAAAPSALPQQAGNDGDLLGQTTVAMGKICITVILFRVLICYFDTYLPLSGLCQVILEGLLELTNGCCDLDLAPIRFRTAVAGVLMSLGGTCVFFQTRAVTQGLRLKWYLLGKGIQAVTCLLGIFCPTILGCLFFVLLFSKMWVAFSKARLYNKATLQFRRKLCFFERK